MRFGAVILAAGASQRMGRPKANLEFAPETALSIALGNCRRAGGGRTVAVLGRDAEAIRSRHAGILPPPLWVENPSPERGRTGSLKLGLGALEPELDGFLVYPVDYPLVLAADVELLLSAAARPEAGHFDVLVPSHGRRRGHPILCRMRIREAFFALGDDDPARTVIHRRQERIFHVETENPGVLLDVNTPEDYRRAQKVWSLRRGDSGRPHSPTEG